MGTIVARGAGAVPVVCAPCAAEGGLQLAGAWPPGVLPATQLVGQARLLDAGAVYATNGVIGTAP